MNDPNRNSPPTRSDRPSRSLHNERDEFIATFFRKGAQLTQELVAENERLRTRLAAVEQENAALLLQVRSDEAIRELLQKIEQLEREKDQLTSRFHEAEARSSEYAMTFAEIESELSNLASLYVASKQLHPATQVRTVVQHIREMLEQLVGARSYAIYFVSDDVTRLVPISVRGIAPDAARLQAGQGAVARVFSSGISEVCEDNDLPNRTLEEPAACVPLRLGERVVGVIALVATFEQKTRFLPVDYEFFKLLAAHAASAIVSARLLADAGERIPVIEAFADLGA